MNLSWDWSNNSIHHFFILNLGLTVFVYFTKKKHLKKYGKSFYFPEKAPLVLEIFKCLYFRLPLFSPLPVIAEFMEEAELKINPKNYDVIICLNWNLNTQIV